MKQITCADAESAGKRKQTHTELFLIDRDQLVPWKGSIGLIEPHYPKGDRPAYPLMTRLRVHLMQNWFGRLSEIHQTRKGNQYCLGVKARIGVDDESGLVHSVGVKVANVAMSPRPTESL